jgi:hypothetical protein
MCLNCALRKPRRAPTLPEDADARNGWKADIPFGVRASAFQASSAAREVEELLGWKAGSALQAHGGQ